MREYNRVSGRFWTGKTGKAIRALGRDHQVVALYLLTCPSMSWIGIYYLPIPTLCHEVGIDTESAERVLRSLADADFAHYDYDTETVWVPNAALFQIGRTLEGEKNNLRTGVQNDLVALGEHRFVAEFVSRYGAAYRLGSPFQVTSKGSGDAPGPLRYTETATATAIATATATSDELRASDGKPGAGRRRQGPSRRKPPDFTLTDDLRAYATGVGLEAAAVDGEWEKFADHEFRDPKRDWSAAWRRWARQAAEWAQQRAGAPPTTPRVAESKHAENYLRARGLLTHDT